MIMASMAQDSSVFWRISGFAVRYSTAFIKSGQLLVLSARLWPFAFWLKFWLSRAEDLVVPLGELKFNIRSRRLALKLTDLYMAASCAVLEQYTSRPGFSIRRDDVIVDIGGHIGSFAIYAASRAVSGRVFVYEPDAASYRQLLKNVSLNGLDGRVAAFQEAVGDRSGPRMLYSAKLNSAENNLYKREAAGIEVPGTTLAEILSKNGIDRCDLLKLDCEGAEYEILFRAEKEALGRVRRICIEAHEAKYFGMRGVSACPGDLVALLRRAGFRVEVMRENVLHTFIWAWRD
jgi:FkbM family methyltransferase